MDSKQWIEELSDKEIEQLKLLKSSLNESREPLCNIIMYAFLYKESQIKQLQESKQEIEEPGYFKNFIECDTIILNKLKKLYHKLVSINMEGLIK